MRGAVRPKKCADRTSEVVYDLICQILVDHSSDVVFAKDVFVHLFFSLFLVRRRFLRTGGQRATATKLRFRVCGFWFLVRGFWFLVFSLLLPRTRAQPETKNQKLEN